MTGALLDQARVRALTIAALLAIPLTAGCPAVTDTDDLPPVGVKGVWIVTHVDGAPLPPAGFELEPGILARSLSITFNKPDNGSALGIYQIVRNGVGEPPKKAAGQFVYTGNDEEGNLVVFAYNEALSGRVFFNVINADQIIVYTDRNGNRIRRAVELRLRR